MFKVRLKDYRCDMHFKALKQIQLKYRHIRIIQNISNSYGGVLGVSRKYIKLLLTILTT